MDSWTGRTDSIEVTTEREVAVIRMNRPDKLNALTADMRRDLADALRFYGDGDRARGIVLTGTGRAFSAGEDLSAIGESGESDGVRVAVELFHDITRAALASKVPVIAALNGLAVGGACEMTLCFDGRIGTSDAGFYLPENHLGLVISNASSLLLHRLMHPSDVTRFVLGSQRLDAAQAQRVGMLDEVVDGDPVETAVSLILSWSQPGSSTAGHLQLLRPAADEIHRAMENESAVAKQVWDAGISSAGVQRFWEHKAKSGS